jgi:D-serine deaminase-like pyridoxal phosphate-dependent protein
LSRQSETSEDAAALPDPLLNGLVKGWPALGVTASALVPGSLSVAQLPTPALTISEPALRANIEAMAAWCAARSLLLAPHAKTTLAAELIGRQLDAGAWGMTVADVRQARIAIASGARNVLIANQVLDPGALEWVAHRSAAAARGRAGETLICIDSMAGLERAAGAAGAPGGAAPTVLVEIGYRDGRCGVRDDDEALLLARAAAAEPGVRLGGIELFEGLIGMGGETGALAEVEELLARTASLMASVCELVEIRRPLISAGGSAYFDRVAAVLGEPAAQLGWDLCLRSGCYVTHDHGIYERIGPAGRGAAVPRFRAAIELRATVLSRPQADRLILNAGRRDVSYDAGLPVVLAPENATMEVVALNDQHAHVRVDPAAPVAVGDLIRLGISHPCTTLDRWPVLAIVDGEGLVLSAAPTCF